MSIRSLSMLSIMALLQMSASVPTASDIQADGNTLSLETKDYNCTIVNISNEQGWEIGFDIIIESVADGRSIVLSSNVLMNNVSVAVANADRLVLVGMLDHYCEFISSVDLSQGLDKMVLSEPVPCMHASLSPNGMYVAYQEFYPRFTKSRFKKPHVLLASIKSVNTSYRLFPREESEDIEDGRVHEPISSILWSKDSKQIVFIEKYGFLGQFTQETVYNLVLIDLSGGEGKEVYRVTELNPNDFQTGVAKKMQLDFVPEHIDWTDDGLLRVSLMDKQQFPQDLILDLNGNLRRVE